jgi:hypothetical protein
MVGIVVVAGIIGGLFFFSRLEPLGGNDPVATNPETNVDPDAGPAAAGTVMDSIIRAEDLPGFDTEHLSDRQRLWVFHQANLEQCSCGCDMTIAQCRVEDPTCPVSPGRAREMVEEAARIEG